MSRLRVLSSICNFHPIASRALAVSLCLFQFKITLMITFQHKNCSKILQHFAGIIVNHSIFCLPLNYFQNRTSREST